MDEIIIFNSKVLKVSGITLIILSFVQLIDYIDFYNDFFFLASFFSLPFCIVGAIVFICSAILQMKIDTIKKNQLT